MIANVSVNLDRGMFAYDDTVRIHAQNRAAFPCHKEMIAEDHSHRILSGVMCWDWPCADFGLTDYQYVFTVCTLFNGSAEIFVIQ